MREIIMLSELQLTVLILGVAVLFTWIGTRLGNSFVGDTLLQIIRKRNLKRDKKGYYHIPVKIN